MSKKITRDSYITRRTKARKITVPEYGDYYLKVLTRAEFDAVEAKTKALKPGDSAALTKGLIVAALTDEDGSVLFDYTKVEDLDLIGNFEFPVVTALDAELTKRHFPKLDNAALATSAKN